jgi:hypothetical protein
MMLRHEDDFTRTADAASDLADIVTTYLQLFRQYTNGDNGVQVPASEFVVTFTPLLKENYITVDVWWTDRYTTQIPTFVDVLDDMYNDNLGADNSNGYTLEHSESNETRRISIPVRLLMLNEVQMRAHFVAQQLAIKEAKIEASRVSRIVALKEELAKLENL